MTQLFFLLKILKQLNYDLVQEYYKIKELCRNNKILKLEIKVKKSLIYSKQSKVGAKKDPSYNTITIVDYLNILNQSLYKLCRSFNLPVTKGDFPYLFIKRDTLNYVGNTPGYEY